MYGRLFLVCYVIVSRSPAYCPSMMFVVVFRAVFGISGRKRTFIVTKRGSMPGSNLVDLWPGPLLLECMRGSFILYRHQIVTPINTALIASSVAAPGFDQGLWLSNLSTTDNKGKLHWWNRIPFIHCNQVLYVGGMTPYVFQIYVCMKNETNCSHYAYLHVYLLYSGRKSAYFTNKISLLTTRDWRLDFPEFF